MSVKNSMTNVGEWMTKHPGAVALAKLLVGLGILGFIIWYVGIGPLLELLWVFLMLMVLPIIILSSMGLVAHSTAQLIMNGPSEFRAMFTDTMKNLKNKVDQQRATMEQPATKTI